MRYFSNPVYCGQDPFVCKGPDGLYYSVAESANAMGIDVFRSDRLSVRGTRVHVFDAFPRGKSSAEIWAPELWYLRGKWYIYYAGGEGAGQVWWDTHRMFVLEADAPTGPYRFCGELELGDRMAIDGTVMQLPDGRLIFFYMGKQDEKNCLFMAQMDTPTHISGESVMLTSPTYPWEADICEGPFAILRGDRVHLMYSANAAHLPDYCIAMMTCTDPAHILDPKSWIKDREPLVRSNAFIKGPGHACMVKSPDETEDWLVYHSKFTDDNTLPGGWDRAVSMVPVDFDENGRFTVRDLPRFGERLRVPSGEKSFLPGRRVCVLASALVDQYINLCYNRKWSYACVGDRLRLDGSGCTAMGNKLLLPDSIYTDCSVTVEVSPVSETGYCGIVLRVTDPAAGAFFWKGYGVLVDRSGEIRLIRCDGKEICVLDKAFSKKETYCFTVSAVGDTLSVWESGRCLIKVRDNSFSSGMIGLYAPDGTGDYGKLTVEPCDDRKECERE